MLVYILIFDKYEYYRRGFVLCDVLECFDEISVEFKFLSYEKEN